MSSGVPMAREKIDQMVAKGILSQFLKRLQIHCACTGGVR